MSTGKNSKNTIEILLIRLIENDLSDQEIECLNRWLEEDPEAVDKYCSFLRDCAIIQSLVKGQIDCQDSGLEDAEFDRAMWEALSEFEKNAPEIEVAAPVSIPRVSVGRNRMAEVHVARSRPSRLHLFTLLVSAAAILFFVIFIRVTTPDPNVEVATLLDMVDVRWVDSTVSLQKGDRLFTGHEPLNLSQGIIQIETDRGVMLTIEGPAEFEFTKEADLSLLYGRIYASVSLQGIGFSVSTSNSKIVDLGTEFGIKADLDETELHVVKGRTVLIAGAADRSKKQSEIQQGQARRVTQQGVVQDIVLKKDVFVRQVNSETGFIWKGQAINLADIVGKGNGFGMGMPDSMIDQYTGKILSAKMTGAMSGPFQQYTRVEASPFVDGVFVPDGGNGPVVITSQGHLFEGCSDTNGRCWGGISNNAQHESDSTNIPRHFLRLDSVVYDGKKNTAIYMHANQGVTFDLKAIRQMVPDMSVSRFEAICGISDTLEDYKNQLQAFDYGNSRWAKISPNDTKADIYVLVDGQVRFSKTDMTVQDDAMNLSVDIYPEDRFLTLVTTQGSDTWGITDDWTLFGEPRLSIRPK